MARIFDNIEQALLVTLRATLQVSRRSDFCVGYLNLRGWHAIDGLIAPWDAAAGQVCRARLSGPEIQRRLASINRDVLAESVVCIYG